MQQEGCVSCLDAQARQRSARKDACRRHDRELSVDIDVDAPHQKIVQIIGTSTGKSALEPRRAGERSPDEEERVGRKVGKYVDFVRIKAAGGKKVLVITYKSIEHRFAGIDGVETGHFGALEGIDRWKD